MSLKNKFREKYQNFRRLLYSVKRSFGLHRRDEKICKTLIDLHKSAGYHFGVFENERYIETIFTNDNNESIKFHFRIEADNLVYSALILPEFDVDRTNDILVLSAHFNSLLTFGMVRVDLKNNYVELVHKESLVSYHFFSGEIMNDLRRHYNVANDCLWAYNEMITSGEDPVFIMSELLRRIEKENDTTNA